MATTDFDGTNLMIVGEGTLVTITIGDRRFIGVLQMHKEGTQEHWYIVAGDGSQIRIDKRPGSLGFTFKEA